MAVFCYVYSKISSLFAHSDPITTCPALPFIINLMLSVPLQAWSGLEGSRNLRFPDYATVAQDGSKVVSLMLRLLFTPRK